MGVLTKDVVIGGKYLAKITKDVVTVQIKETANPRGWWAINLETGRTVRIKSCKKLRRAV